MNNALMFSKASDEWSTPREFYAALDAEFSFDFDAAASRDNRQRDLYFGLDHEDPALRDALAVDWHLWGDTFWLNPPYSKCREFIAKAVFEAAMGCTVVCLVPARTDTRWFHDLVWDVRNHAPRPNVEVRFVRGRLKFGNTGKPENSAPFPSVVIIFRGSR